MAVFIPSSVFALVYDDTMACRQAITRNLPLGGYFVELVAAISQDAKQLLLGHTMSTFSSSNEFPGKDMYLEMYYRVQWETFDKAIEETANETGFSTHEIKAIIQGSSFPVAQANSRLDVHGVLEEVRTIQELYRREKDLLDLEQALDTDIASSTIFSNGTTDDSGFDIIVDLNIINKLMFLSEGEVDSPLAFRGDSIATAAVFDDGDLSLSHIQQNINLSRLFAAVDTDRSLNDSSDSGICLADEKLTSAIEDKIQEAEKVGSGGRKNDDGENKHVQDDQDKSQQGKNVSDMNNGSDNQGKSRKKTEVSGSEASVSRTATAGSDSVQQYEAKFVSEDIPHAQGKDWKISSLCSDIFCVKLNFANDEKSTYQDTDNCIACHIQKINNILEETTSNNLSPKKVPGNLLEPNFCKDNVVLTSPDIGIQFFVMKNPLISREKDDKIIESQGSFQEHSRSYTLGAAEKFATDPAKVAGDELDPGTGEVLDPKQLLIPHERSKIAEGTPFTEVQSRVQGLLENRQRNIADAVNEYEIVSKLQNQVSYFQDVSVEINAMQTYFASFRDVFNSLVWGQDNICDALMNKRTCS